MNLNYPIVDDRASIKALFIKICTSKYHMVKACVKSMFCYYYEPAELSTIFINCSYFNYAILVAKTHCFAVANEKRLSHIQAHLTRINFLSYNWGLDWYGRRIFNAQSTSANLLISGVLYRGVNSPPVPQDIWYLRIFVPRIRFIEAQFFFGQCCRYLMG